MTDTISMNGRRVAVELQKQTDKNGAQKIRVSAYLVDEYADPIGPPHLIAVVDEQFIAYLEARGGK